MIDFIPLKVNSCLVDTTPNTVYCSLWLLIYDFVLEATYFYSLCTFLGETSRSHPVLSWSRYWERRQTTAFQGQIRDTRVQVWRRNRNQRNTHETDGGAEKRFVYLSICLLAWYPCFTTNVNKRQNDYMW